MSLRDTHLTEVLVIGAGLAGERAAIEAARRGCEVRILSLVPPRRSHSTAAQGGMQGSLANCAKGLGDNPDVHFADTVKGADWGCEQDVARLFADNAVQAIRELNYWGVPWSRVVAGKRTLPDGEVIEDLTEKGGLITARAFGATTYWRTCYTSDATGHTVQYAIDSVVLELGIPVHDRVEVISLIHNGERCLGAIARDLRTGNLLVYLAKATVIATGGYGRLYGKSTNAVINEGTGMSIALDTGLVPLGNMEAVQFHPTGLVPSWVLITEGARGDGGYLLDKNGHRFMVDYEPAKKELASRDVVSRRMMEHIGKGYGVESPYGDYLWLDIRHLGAQHINTNLKEIAGICRHIAGIDPVTSLIPVRPTQHYSMGGIRTNIDGAAYGLKGLFAVGEASCWDLHGFNRLGGNSLAETVVMGMLVGDKVADYVEEVSLEYSDRLIRDFYLRQQSRIDALLRNKGNQNPYKINREMEETLSEKVGIFRNGQDLSQAVEKLKELLGRCLDLKLRADGRGRNPELELALRLPGMLKLALCISYGALQRTESRGSHYREDYPRRNDKDWLKRTLAYWPEGNGLPRLEYEPVTITEIPPGERGYGEAVAGEEIEERGK